MAIRIQSHGEPGLRFLLEERLEERLAIEQDEARLSALLLGLTYERRDDVAVQA